MKKNYSSIQHLVDNVDSGEVKKCEKKTRTLRSLHARDAPSAARAAPPSLSSRAGARHTALTTLPHKARLNARKRGISRARTRALRAHVARTLCRTAPRTSRKKKRERRKKEEKAFCVVWKKKERKTD